MHVRYITWDIGKTTPLAARVTSYDGAGAATGQAGEGNYITAAQVSTITCTLYDRSSATPNTSIGTVSITSAAVIAATTSTANWTEDSIGHNFEFGLTSALIATAGRIYRAVIEITLTTGTILAPFAFEGEARDLSP